MPASLTGNCWLVTSVEPRIWGAFGFGDIEHGQRQVVRELRSRWGCRQLGSVPAVPRTRARLPLTATSRRLIVPGMVNEVTTDMFLRVGDVHDQQACRYCPSRCCRRGSAR